MRPRDKLANRLQALDPRSDEFYAAAARYFRQRVRSHRNYGRFFLLLAAAAWAAFFLNWGRWFLALMMLPAFLFCGVLGWIGIAGAARTAKAISDADQEKELSSRLRRLREVAVCFPGDPIGTLVSQAIDKPDEKAML